MLRDLIALPDDSKVWIYQADTNFSDKVKEDVRQKIREFVSRWDSHGMPIEAYGNLFHQQFVVLVANENYNSVSGCSIDSSVALIRELESQFGLNMFDRMAFTYLDENENVQTISQFELSKAYKKGIINDDTLFFNNLVNTKEKFINNWLTPLKDSWHFRFIN